MKLPLLEGSTDAPSRVPYLRGLPSERAIAVDTSALPRQLPLPALDPTAGTAPLEALARLGATGQKVSEGLLSTVLEAERKKRDADDLAEATSLYTQVALKLDEEFERLKTSESHTSLRPAFDKLWKDLAGRALQLAPNPRVQQHLGLKLAGLRVSKSAEVSDAVRRKFVDYHQASLSESSKALVQQATDPDALPFERDFAIANLESLYRGYAASGIFPADQLVRMRQEVLTTIHNTLAHQAMSKDPEAFMPKAAGGADGYRVFSANGKYPADPKYLESLTAQAPKLVEHLRNQQRLESERRERAFQAQMENAFTQKYDQMVGDLMSDDPERVRVASESVEQAIAEAGLFWSDTRKQTLRELARRSAERGGVTDSVTYNDLAARMYLNPFSVTEDELGVALFRGKLAKTGDRSYTTLISKLRELRKGDDISQRSDYEIGRGLITTALGGGPALDLIQMAMRMGPRELARHKYFVSKALEEFDTRARTPEWQGKNLRDLGAEIRDHYVKLLYEEIPSLRQAVPAPAPGSTPAPGTGPAAPPGPGTSPAAPAKKAGATQEQRGFHWLFPNWFSAPAGE